MNLLLLCAAALATGLVVERIAASLRLPRSALLMASGFIVSELIVAAGYDTGLRWYHYRDLSLNLLLPILVVSSIIRIRGYAKLTVLCAAIAYSLLLVAGEFAGLTALLWLGMGHPLGFPISAAMVAAAMLIAVEPEVPSRRVGGTATAKAAPALELEAALGDVFAVSVLGALLTQSALGQASVSLQQLLPQIEQLVATGLALGLTFVLLIRVWWRYCPTAVMHGRKLIAFLLILFLVTQLLGSAGGALAVLIIWLGVSGQFAASELPQPALLSWLERGVRALVFVLAGITITPFMFTDQWLAMLIAISAVIVLRAILVGLLSLAGHFEPRLRHISRSGFHIMCGGTRGAVVVALALSLPLEFGNWYTVQAMAYGVVIATSIIFPAASAIARWRSQHLRNA